MIDETELTRRLTATLRARADQEARPPGRFDPERADAAVLPLAEAPSARRRVPRPVLAAAAVAVVVGAAAVTWSVRSPDGEDGNVSAAVPPAEPDTVRPRFPDGVPAPTGPVPGGLALWAMDLRPPVEGVGTVADPGMWTQLFADADDPGAMVLVDHATPVSAPANPLAEGAEGQPVMVRGHDGIVGEYGDGAYDLSALYWMEGDSSFTAAFRGMTAQEAVAAVDALRERSDGRVGFDAPADGSVTVLGEALDPAPLGAYTDFFYGSEVVSASGPPDRVWLQTRAATGGTTSTYLHGWFTGERAGDGTVVSYLPEIRHVSVVWPDGQVASVEGLTGQATTQQTLEQFVRSVRPTTAGELGDLWSEMNATVAGLPVIASAELPSGTVELHGPDGAPQAVCLRLAVGTACSYVVSGGGDMHRLSVGLDVGGVWYVAVATKIPGTRLSHDVPLETASAGGWDLHLARPADGIESLDVGDDSDTGVTLYRPLGL